MKFNIQKTAIIILCLVISSVTFARGKKPKHSFIIKTGSFVLANKTQAIGGINTTFGTTSSSVSSIAYEKKNKKGLSWGVEYTTYKNNYSTPSVTGVATSTHIMVNLKKYFKVSKHVQPFVGAGGGASVIILKSDTTGSTGGAVALGYQAMAGIVFPFKRVSLILEYKIISAQPTDTVGDSVDISGSGAFAGISFNF